MNIFGVFFVTWGRFHQHSMSSICARRSQNRKKTEGLTVIFALSGSARTKAALRMLMKLTPDNCVIESDANDQE